MIEDTDEQSDGRDAQGKVCAQGHTASILFSCVSLHQPTSSLNPILLGFLQRLHNEGIMDPSLHFQPFSHLKRMGSGAENLKFVIIVGSFGVPALI